MLLHSHFFFFCLLWIWLVQWVFFLVTLKFKIIHRFIHFFHWLIIILINFYCVLTLTFLRFRRLITIITRIHRSTIWYWVTCVTAFIIFPNFWDGYFGFWSVTIECGWFVYSVLGTCFKVGGYEVAWEKFNELILNILDEV